MSIGSLFGGGRDERPSLDAAVIRPLKNGFLFDPDLNGGGLRGATAHVTPEDLAAAVLAWARDFYTRATEQLRAADGADTVVLATMNGKLMHLQTRAPRGPAELVHIARRLLEDAADQCRKSGPRAMRTEDARALAVLHGAIDVALHALPDPDAEAA